MAAPYITAAQVGSYFVTQYYPMLQQTPEFVYRLYSDASTMIRVDGRNRETASGMMHIHTLVMSMRFTSIEIKTAHSLDSWNGGVIVMVTGCVQIEEFTAKRKFAQTFFLAPQEKGFFVINDIFHLMDEDPISPYPATLFSESDVNTKMSVQDSVPSYMVSGVTTSSEYMEGPDVKADHFPFMMQQLVVDEFSGNSFFEAPFYTVQEGPPVEEPVEKHTYASILRAGKGQPEASTVHPCKVSASNWEYTEQNNQVGNPESETSEESKGEMKSVYVRGLTSAMCASEIEEEFKKFGRLGPDGVAIRTVKDTDVRYAFVEFEDITGVQNAVEAATVEVGGRQLYIEERRAASSSARGRRGRGRSSESSRGRRHEKGNSRVGILGF